MTVKLTRGMVAVIDDEDMERVSRYKWCAIPLRKTFYATSWIGGRNVYMHRLISGAMKGQQIDHVNGNGLDNRKQNLRLCNYSENQRNAVYGFGKSGHRGVYWSPSRKKWYVDFMRHGKRVYGRMFENKEAAIAEYVALAQKIDGEFYRPQLGEK